MKFKSFAELHKHFNQPKNQKIMAHPLKHNFKTPFGVIDTNGIAGYQKCLQEVLNYLAEKTEWKPEKRYIDAADLSESIGLTLDELTKLQKEALEEIQNDLPFTPYK